MDFSVSIIIPAYNVEKFIEKAINSVVNQLFINEILIVDDGSSDNTLQILQKLKTEYSIIKILEHKDRVNKGRSASRNLGVKNATSRFIAFLDADDFFLENRFINDKNIFEENKYIDGVYNAVGFYFYREQLDQEENLNLTTISKTVPPKDLFKTLISGKHGYFHINGLTLKKSVFEKVGYFNEKLMVTEDTDYFYKLALKSNLQPGILGKPVAMRGVHDSNVFNRNDLYEEYEIKMYESLYFWSIEKKIGKKIIEKFLERIWILQYRKNNGLLLDIKYWISLVLKNPSTMISSFTLKYFPVIRQTKKIFAIFYKN